MKTVIYALAVAASLGLGGAALAEDKMAAPMADTMMTPAQMLETCQKNAGMAADAMKQDEGKKVCQEAYDMTMGTMGDAMAPADTMKPADSMAPAK
jgi:hypothetical protein